MKSDIIGFILSYVMVFIVIGTAGLLLHFKVVSAEVARKVVHIGVSNWWLLAMYFFTGPFWPALGAASFIIINFISYKKHIFKAMEAPEKKKNLGTVYFPISLLILSLLCFGDTMPPYTGALGILVMGYGDGMAAIIGSQFGKRKFSIAGSKKTLEGTFTMFVVSWCVLYIILTYYNPSIAFSASLACAAVATFAEAFTPFGLDNISVPLATSFVFYGLYL